MNRALEQHLNQFETFDATHHRPIRINDEADMERAYSQSRKRRRGKVRRFNPDADPFRRGMTWRLWNTYSWALDQVAIFNTMNPGYLAKLAGIEEVFSEPLRERWEAWIRDEANYIPQIRRPHIWDYWIAFVEAGELDRFKFDIGKHTGGVVRPSFADVYCESPDCSFPNLTYQIRYSLVQTDLGLVTGMIPTVDDKTDPTGAAGQYQDGYVTIRRRCPWCGYYNVYQMEVTK